MTGKVKTAEDIAILREGGKRLANIVAAVAEKTVPGASTGELNAFVEDMIRDLGDTPAFLGYTPRGAKRPFPAALCLSINDEVVHGIPNENVRKIQDGDIVGLDCGIVHQGLITDHAVSVVAGAGDTEATELLTATRDALFAGIRAARPGNKIGDISAAVEAVGVKTGYGIVYELGGHGVGYAVHEEPYVPNVGDAGHGETLLPGMVLAIEPMFTEGTPRVKLLQDGYTFVTKDGSRSAHFEHTILVTDGDPEILTVM